MNDDQIPRVSVVPSLAYLYTSRIEIDPPLMAGQAPYGERRIINITGGVFEGPRLRGRVLPGGADWLGFDVYHEIAEVSRHLAFLKSRLHTHQRLFLIPQSFLNKAAPDDEALAKLNWKYYDLARSEPLVIGLLNFGLFTHAKAAELPLTLQAQRQIGERIMNRDSRIR